MSNTDNYEQHVTKAWQDSQKIKDEFDRLMLELQYKDLAVDKLAYEYKVDAGTIRSILQKGEK